MTDPVNVILWRLFSQFFLEIRQDLVGRNKVGTINIQKMLGTP